MGRIWLVGAVAIVVTGGSGLAWGQDTGLKVDVGGIRVAQPPYGDDFQMRVLQANGGSSLVLRVSDSDGGLIHYLEDDSKLDGFTDDQGTDLLAGESKMGMVGLASMASISKDGKVALIEINGPTLPKAGAKALQAKGKLSFQMAHKKKSFKTPSTKLEAGAEIKAGPVPFTIKEAGAPEWGEDPLEVTLATTKRDDAVAAVRFFDEDGAVIESRESSSSRMTIGNAIQIERSYMLGRRVDQAVIEITYWMDMKKVETPFDVNATVGL